MNIVKVDEEYLIFKQYVHEDRVYARPVHRTTDLREAVKLVEEVSSSSIGGVPANNIGDGKIAGADLGFNKKKGYKFFDKIATRKAK